MAIGGRRIMQVMALCATVLLTMPSGLAAAEPPPTTDTDPPPGIEYGPTLDLVLSTPTGRPGSTFEATATRAGFRDECDAVQFSWTRGQPVTWTPISAIFEVPLGAEAGSSTVSASCGVVEDAEIFTIEAPPTVEPDVTLRPNKGVVGTEVTIELTGFERCTRPTSVAQPPILWQWDDGELLPLQSPTFSVPETTTPDHRVTVFCGNIRAEEPFTVVVPQLTLEPPEGPPGTSVTVQGEGFACPSGQVDVLWDENAQKTVDSGSFTTRLTVPQGAPTTSTDVRARCTDHPDITDVELFTVTDAVTTTTPVTTTTTSNVKGKPEAGLVLQPDNGSPGDQVAVTGSGFLCTDTSSGVQLFWNSGQPLPAVNPDASGRFTTSTTAPQHDHGKSDTLTARCVDGSLTATAIFALNDGSSPWLLWLVAAMIIAVVVHQIWRKYFRPDITAEVHDRSPAARVRETPGPGQRTLTVGLLVHSDSGAHTITEGTS
jgi:hypothetical protein